MVTSGAGSTVVRRQLGRKLRRLRESANKTHEDVAAAHIASPTTMWRIETGKIAVKPGIIWALAHLYDVSAEDTDSLVSLAAGTREEGWWEDYSAAVPEWVGLYAGLEAACTTIHDYQCELIHGLLQTEEYARAVTRSNPNLTDDVVEQRVAFRMGRQRAVFNRSTPGRVISVVTAGVLDLVVGSPEVMAEQVAHLRTLISGGAADVRVLSHDNGVHPAMRGSFTIMDFDDPDDPSLVYVETLVGSRYLERPEHLEQFREAFRHMQAQAVSLEEYIDDHRPRNHPLDQGLGQ
jgi:transcriptional regulator with XRE-family HTH domain